MATGFIDIMKRAAIDAVENGKPCDLRLGTVVTDSPVNVQLSNQDILEEDELIIPEYLTDYEVEITTAGYGWITDKREGGSGDPSYEAHDHDINQQKKTVKVHGALKTGDQVVLIRESGGQNFYVAGRLPKGD